MSGRCGSLRLHHDLGHSGPTSGIQKRWSHYLSGWWFCSAGARGGKAGAGGAGKEETWLRGRLDLQKNDLGLWEEINKRGANLSPRGIQIHVSLALRLSPL